MRVMALVYSIPKRLDEAVPWHFFQELEALVAQGAELCVGSTVTPEYSLPGVTFVNIMSRSLRRSPGAALAAWRLDRRMRRILPGWKALTTRHRLRLASWNVAVIEHAKRFGAQVIHSHWAVPMGTGGVPAARALGLPCLMTLRGTDHLVHRPSGYGDCLDPVYEQTLCVALRAADRISVTCEDSLRRLEELGIPLDDRVARIDHSVDARRFAGTREEAETFAVEHGMKVGRHQIACIAVMDHERKGQVDLLQASAPLLAEQDAHLFLVGDGRLRPRLEALCRELGIDERVHFLGRVHPREIQHVLRSVTLSVLPTWSEAFGNVAFESLLVGTPVVTSNVGAPGEVIGRYGFGSVFPAGDVTALQGALRGVLSDLEASRSRAGAGGEYVRTQLSVERRARAFASVYAASGSGP
jgi:glycosyltransferase involved in cell wall biosynthesis